MQHIRGVNGPITGKWRISAATGLTAAISAGGTIFSARFGATTLFRALITDFRLKAQIVTAFTAANEISVSASFARSFTVSDSAGTTITPTANNNTLSSVDASTATSFANIQVATTTAMTAGTRTLDTAPFLYMPAGQPGASPTAQAYWETDMSNWGDQRFGPVIQANEGIVVAIPATQGAGGTVRYVVEMEWVEFATNSAEVLG